MKAHGLCVALMTVTTLLAGCFDNTPRCIPATYGDRCTCANGQPGRYICAPDGTSQRECRCGDEVPLDAGPADVQDSGSGDAGDAGDAAPADSGLADAGVVVDGGPHDAGPEDAGLAVVDGGPPDGAPADASDGG